jgi:HK97 family phage major capsid protein
LATGTAEAPQLTRDQVIAILVGPLEQASVFLAAGPRIFDTDGSPVRVPKLTGVTSPDFIGENEEITEDEAAFGEVTLLPHDMASVKVITRLSNELVRQSVVAIDSAMRDRLVRDVAAKIDTALIAGDGADTPTGFDTPLGLLNYSGVQNIPSVASPTLDDLQDAVGLALAANVDTSRLRWFMRSNVFVFLRKLKDSTGRYMIQPDPTQEGAFRLLGHAVIITNRIPYDTDTDIVLADFSTIAVARDLAPTVTILPERYAEFDQIGIRVVARYDAAPLLPEAIVILRGVTV